MCLQVLRGRGGGAAVRLYMLDSNTLTQADLELVRWRFPARYARACRMRREEDRRSVIGSGVLLHRALGVERESSLGCTPAGRPYLEQGPVFSLSHSGGRCLLAVGEGRRVGVDLERLDPDNLSAAPAALGPAELAWIREEPMKRFHILWTRKEALYKALGGYTDPKQIPALEEELPPGLSIRSAIFEGFALSLCADEKLSGLDPAIIKTI